MGKEKFDVKKTGVFNEIFLWKAMQNMEKTSVKCYNYIIMGGLCPFVKEGW